LEIKIVIERTTTVKTHATGEDFAPNSSKNIVVAAARTSG
jgi:hypothetical protein